MFWAARPSLFSASAGRTLASLDRVAQTHTLDEAWKRFGKPRESDWPRPNAKGCVLFVGVRSVRVNGCGIALTVCGARHDEDMALVRLGKGWRFRIELVFDQLEPTTSAEFGLPDQAVSIDTLCACLDLLVSWNARTDLISVTSAEELVDLYLADAAILAAHANASGKAMHWIDVGSAAGAPGLGVGLMAPTVELTLVEPQATQAAFLRAMLGHLGCAGVRVEREQSHALPERGWDVASCRKAMAATEWLAEGTRLARQGVWVLLDRSPAPTAANWRVQHDLRYRWPLTHRERRAVYFVPEPQSEV